MSTEPERIKRGTLDHKESIRVIGAFDFNDERLNAMVLEIIGSGSKDLVLDFSETLYLTGMGIAAMVKMYKKVKAANGTLYVAGATEDMGALIRLASLDKYVQFIS